MFALIVTFTPSETTLIQSLSSFASLESEMFEHRLYVTCGPLSEANFSLSHTYGNDETIPMVARNDSFD